MQDSSDRLADALVSRELDIAVLYHRPRNSELEFIPLMEVELGLVVPKETGGLIPADLVGLEAMTLAQVARLPLILPRKGQVQRDLIENSCKRQRIEPDIVMESDSLPLSRSLVAAGQGCTILALGGVHDEVQRGELRFIPIHSPSIPWRMFAATAKNRTETLAVKAMAIELSAHIRSSATNLRWNGRLLDTAA
jgi:DNA-binding transcriptional LysR family regulator